MPQKAEWSTRTLLGRLDPPARAALLGAGVRRRYGTGEVLIHEGLPESHVILLEDALVKVTAQLVNGRQALIAIRVSGDAVGEMSALDTLPCSATVTTCRPSVVRLIGHNSFRAYLREHPDAAIAIAAIVADRLRAANRHRVDFASYPVKTRVARALAELGHGYGRPAPGGIAVDIEITQSELAALCGAADITVHKSLRELREAGLVDTNYRGFVIRDPGALLALARLDPSGQPVEA